MKIIFCNWCRRRREGGNVQFYYLSTSETQSLLQYIFCERTSKATGETDEESDANI